MVKQKKRKLTTQISISLDAKLLEKFKELGEDHERNVSNYIQFMIKRELESHGLIKKKEIEALEID